jgi:hypothetical protein
MLQWQGMTHCAPVLPKQELAPRRMVVRFHFRDPPNSGPPGAIAMSDKKPLDGLIGPAESTRVIAALRHGASRRDIQRFRIWLAA